MVTLLNPPFSNPPSWDDELRVALHDPDKRWRSSVSVDIVSATTALGSWLRDRRPFSTNHRPSWESALKDVEDDIARLGPSVCLALGSEIAEVNTIIGDLRFALSHKKERDVQSLLVASAGNNRSKTDRLRARLNDSSTRSAAWTDLVSGCRDSALPYDSLAHRRDLFWTLLQTASYDTRRLSSTLSGIIGDRELDILSARIWLGELEPSALRSSHPFAQANMGEQERLILCERLVTQPSSRAHHVVWVAYKYAHLTDAYQAFGALTFYKKELLEETVRHPDAFPWTVPAELRPADSFFSVDNLPDGEEVVLVRVDLGTTALTDPALAAQKEADSVIALAKFHTGYSRWRPLQGYMHAIDGRIASISHFMEPLDTDALPRPPSLDPINDELKDLESSLSPLLPINDPDLLEIIDATHSWHEARQQSPLSSILLNVRIIEVIASRVTGGPWFRFLDGYLSRSWIRRRMHDSLHQAIYQAAYKNIDQFPQPIRDEQARWRSSIFTHRAAYGFRADLRAGLDALPFFVTLYAPHEQRAREIKQVAQRLSSTAEVARWRDRLEVDWTASRMRLHSLRNALAHGGPVDLDGTESVHRFAEQLAATSLSIGIRGILSRNTVASQHELHKTEADAWFESIAKSPNVGDSLFRH